MPPATPSPTPKKTLYQLRICSKLRQRNIKNNIEFIEEPYIRFKGEELEQETMFIKDPNDNILELKTMINPNALFK